MGSRSRKKPLTEFLKAGLLSNLPGSYVKILLVSQFELPKGRYVILSIKTTPHVAIKKSNVVLVPRPQRLRGSGVSGDESDTHQQSNCSLP